MTKYPREVIPILILIPRLENPISPLDKSIFVPNCFKNSLDNNRGICDPLRGTTAVRITTDL